MIDQGVTRTDWTEFRLGSLLISRTRRGGQHLPLLSVVREQGVILRDVSSKEANHNFIPDDLSNYKVVEPGQLVINKMKAWSGSLGIAGQAGIVSPAYFVYDVAIENKRFSHYLLRSRKVVDEFARCSGGVRVGQWDLNIPAMKSIRIRKPSGDEQELIVRYLDHAELRIAKAIAAKLELVRLLVEQRKVIESELIFGGGWKPNSDRWFGDLPKSWKVEGARALFSERVERGRSDLEMLSVTISRGVVQQSEYLKSAGSKKDQARQDRSQYKVVEMGDIVYNKMRAWQGAAGASRYQGIVSPAYVVVSPREGINSDYYGLVVRTPQFAREAERNSYGIVSDMWSLRPQHFKMIEFPNPPLAEQLEIVERCEATTRNLVGAIDSVEREVALLKEYRTRLISDVVTGKLDVRAEAAKLPVIDPHELVEVTAGAGLTAEDDGDDE